LSTVRKSAGLRRSDIDLEQRRSLRARFAVRTKPKSRFTAHWLSLESRVPGSGNFAPQPASPASSDQGKRTEARDLLAPIYDRPLVGRIDQADRRELSVMFCDLVGPETLSARPDPVYLVRAYKD